MERIDIELLYFNGCPNWQTARDHLSEALNATGHTDAHVSLHLVETDEEAQEQRFTGSPTIRVDGQDLFQPQTDTYGLTCRIYTTPNGLAGSPSTDQLVHALS